MLGTNLTTRYFIILQPGSEFFNALALANKIAQASGLTVGGSTSPATMSFLGKGRETTLRVYWNPGVEHEGHSVYGVVLEEGAYKISAEKALQKLVDDGFLFEFKIVPVIQ